MQYVNPVFLEPAGTSQLFKNYYETTGEIWVTGGYVMM